MRAILRSLGKALIVSAAAASVISMAAAPALAATTWTVKPGGAVAGTAKPATVTDSSKGLSVTCTSSVVKGTLKHGSGLPGAGIGTIASFTFKGCMVAGFTVTVKVAGKMLLNATGPSPATTVVNMTITKMHGSFSVAALSCSATIDGTKATAHNGMVTATFTNSTDTLTVLTTGGNLHLYNPSSGCTTAVSNGDSVNFTGGYKLSPAQKITSP